MSYSSNVSAGDDIVSSQYNNLRKDIIRSEISNLVIGYSGNNVASVADNGVTMTFTYSGGNIVSWTDGVNTWTVSYSGGRIVGVVKS